MADSWGVVVVVVVVVAVVVVVVVAVAVVVVVVAEDTKTGVLEPILAPGWVSDAGRHAHSQFYPRRRHLWHRSQDARLWQAH